MTATTSIAGEYIAAGTIIKRTSDGVEALVIKGAHNGETLTVSRMDTSPGDHETWPCKFMNLSLVSQRTELTVNVASAALLKSRSISQLKADYREALKRERATHKTEAASTLNEVRRIITVELLERMGREDFVLFEAFAHQKQTQDEARLTAIVAKGAKKLEAELECHGHPAGEFDPMGETVYCDGSC